MSGHSEFSETPIEPRRLHPGVAALDRLFDRINALVMLFCAVALVAAAVVLTESVFVRYFLHATTDWQDEATVFLLVGATFMSTAYVQSQRGHVGIEALAGLLPPGVDRARRMFVDIVSFAFCVFFAWKSWTLTHEAFVDGQTTSSTWGPPLWIPYSLMATGVSLLAAQIFVQILAWIVPATDKSEPHP
jgi:TRAP-type C4-dicarboxylate transport system permease small subunit